MTPAPGPITVRPVTDTRDMWNRAAASFGSSGLAHAPEWFTAIRESYGHEPLYLAASDDNGCGGILPAFVVRRPLFGTVVTSMPFLDGGGPCTVSAAWTSALLAGLVDLAGAIGARAVELRCTDRLPIAVSPAEHKVNMTLPLPENSDALWRGLDKSVRNQIRKAERSGLSVESGGLDRLDAFYDAFVRRMRDLGSPVHGRGFLRAVLSAFGERARVVLVQKGHATVGGLVALSYKDRTVVPWAACLKEYFPLCPNMLLYWEAIRRASANGSRRFEFGRSTRGSGTYRFKWQWGAREEPLFWYTIAAAGAAPAAAAPTGGGGLATKVWQRLPLAATRHLGPRIRKFLIQ